jgi:PKD repeat protein
MQPRRNAPKQSILQFVLGLLFLIPVCLHAQYRINPIAEERRANSPVDRILKKHSLYRINTGELSRYVHSKGKGSDIDLELNLPEGSFNMILEENDILSPGYQLLVDGVIDQKTNNEREVITYRGRLAGEDKSSIYLTITGKMIFGYIKTATREYYIEPLRNMSKAADPGLFVWYEAADVIPSNGPGCAVTEVAERQQQLTQESALLATGTCRMVETAIASDLSMLERYGTAIDVQDHNIAVMNMMVGIFQNAQFGTQYLEFKIVAQYVATSVANEPYSPLYSGDNVDVLLNNFALWGNLRGFGQFLSYDMAQLWTARNIAYYAPNTTTGNYSVIGYAAVGATCTSRRYQVLEDFSSSISSKSIMAAHETGHNLGAQHDAVNAPYIMAPSINEYNVTFSPTSISVITTYISGAGGACFSSCNSSNPVAEFSSSLASVCLGESITFTDYSAGEVSSRFWEFEDGTPATSTSKSPAVSFNSPGLKTVTLTVTNATGSNTKVKTVFVSAPPVIACKQAGNNSQDNGVITGFQLAGIRYFRGVYFTNGGLYDNESCTQITKLAPGKTYNAIADIGLAHVFNDFSAPTRLQILLDFNNDGDFDEPGEQLYYNPVCQEAYSTVQLTMPETVPVINQYLRLRVIALPCSQGASDGCTIPVNTQVLDFSVYFNESTCLKTWYRDADSDSYGDPEFTISSCTQPAGYVDNNRDCNDGAAAIKPGATEICDGIDNDCDGMIDENVKTTFYLDGDNDGYGSATTVQACSSPEGYVSIGGDCNDSDPAVNPGTSEVCSNGKDDNCNAVTDETACVPCANASSINTSQITETTAVLNWVASANPLIWEVRYKRTGPGAQWITLPQLTGNVRNVTIMDLAPGAMYNWQVRAKCNKAWTKYTDVTTFSTLPGNSITGAGIRMEMESETSPLKVSVRPNPSNNEFTLQVLPNGSKDPVQITVSDILGRVIENKKLLVGEVLRIGGQYKSGTYFVKALQGNQTSILKLVKAGH